MLHPIISLSFTITVVPPVKFHSLSRYSIGKITSEEQTGLVELN